MILLHNNKDNNILQKMQKKKKKMDNVIMESEKLSTKTDSKLITVLSNILLITSIIDMSQLLAKQIMEFRYSTLNRLYLLIALNLVNIIQC